ncbi:cytochrome P450 [Janibacter anophelis]|uniref:cytochrome P450 n=1 Tax=Janibacter anophelis TaxID=319054 RepID=UPI001962484E|nr:cytochrome P450 [Janibacter anophelis]
MDAVDLSAPDLLDNPYPLLARWRSTGPVLRAQDGRWVATTHAAVSATLRDRGMGRIWSDWQPVDQMEPFNTLHRNQLMENEPPTHTRMRRLLAGAFAKGHVERMRPRIERLADALLDELDPTRPVDLLAAYAEPMPVFVIADLLGVPREDHVRLRDWSQAIVRMYEQGVDEEVRGAAVRASEEFAAYTRDVIEQRRRHPGDDLVSDLITARDAGGGFSDDELVATVILLLNAGHEASVNVFGNGVNALLAHPDELARVNAGDGSDGARGGAGASSPTDSQTAQIAQRNAARSASTGTAAQGSGAAGTAAGTAATGGTLLAAKAAHDTGKAAGDAAQDARGQAQDVAQDSGSGSDGGGLAAASGDDAQSGAGQSQGGSADGQAQGGDQSDGGGQSGPSASIGENAGGPGPQSESGEQSGLAAQVGENAGGSGDQSESEGEGALAASVNDGRGSAGSWLKSDRGGSFSLAGMSSVGKKAGKAVR